MSTCQSMRSQSHFVFYFEQKAHMIFWFKTIDWQPLAVLHHGSLSTLHDKKILILTGTTGNRLLVVCNFDRGEKILVYIHNWPDKKVISALIYAILHFHPKKYLFIDLVSIKDNNMAFHSSLDRHPLGQIFNFIFQSSINPLWPLQRCVGRWYINPHKIGIPRTVNRNRNRPWRADSYDGIAVSCVSLRSGTRDR